MTTTANRTTTLRWADISVGDEVTPLEDPHHHNDDRRRGDRHP